MKTTTVIKKENSEDLYIVNADDVQGMNLHDTYNCYGIKADEYSAGDYSILNPECDLLDRAKEAGAKIFGEQFYDIEISSCDGDIEITNIGDLEDMLDYEFDMLNFLMDFEDEHAVYNKVNGITYWNGNFHETIIVDDEDYVSDELKKEVLDAYEEAEFEPTSAAGIYEATTEDFTFLKKSFPTFYIARAERI